jgi:hypothetical protein
MKRNSHLTAIMLLASLMSGMLPSADQARHRGNDYLQPADSGHSGGVPWNALSGDEQAALKNYRRNWNAYSPAQQNKLRQGARRYLDLPPRERDAVKRKQQQYRNMSPQEREQLREQYRNRRD